MADPANPAPIEPAAVASPPAAESPPAGVAVSPAPAAEPVAQAAGAEASHGGGASAPSDPADVPTLLEEHPAAKAAAEPAKPPAEPGKEPATPAEVKAGEPAKPADAKPAEPKAPEPEAKPAEPVKPEPVEYKYAVPEVIKLDDARKAEFHTALDEFRANPAGGAQKLMDMHASAMTAFKDSLLQLQKDAFNDVRKGWRTEVLADSELGGAGHMTAMQAIARVRDAAVSSAKPGTKQYHADMAAFNDALRVTGAGDHPAILRAFHNMARWMDEPQSTSIPGGITPPKGNGKPPRSSIYDHPSSQKMAAGRS